MNETTSYDAASYWTVHCTPGGSLCDDDEAFVVIVTGSDDVVLRYEDSVTAGDGDVARVSAKESDSLVAQLMVIDSLPVLELSAKEGKLDVVLLRKERGIQCHNVNVDLLGSGNVVVQATGSLSGDVYGSGHLKYYGDAPNSIYNINYMGLVTASPVSGSYQPSGCKTKASSSSPGVVDKSVGYEFSYDVAIDQSNLVYLAGIVFLVALVLRWFNESRRRAWEEQRQPLVAHNYTYKANLVMKYSSLFTALAFALSQSVVDGTLSVTSMEPTRSNELNGAFLEKIWTIHAEAGDVLDDLKVQVAGNVFVDYDASLRGADGTVAAKVIMRSSSPDMANLVDVTVHEADGSGVRVHYKNTNARVMGEVVTQIIVSDRNALSSVSAAHSDSVVLGEGVVVSDDPSASLELDTSGDAEIYVGSSTQDHFSLKSIDIASSGDGHVQFLASSVQADTVTVSLSGDSKAVIVATDRITVDSMVTAISGDGKIFVETANLQSQKLSASLSGDGKVSYFSGGSCVDQTIHLSGDATIYAGSIVCKSSMVATSGDGKAIVQTTDTLTSVGGGSVKYVNAAPHRIVSSSIFRKHSNVKPAKYNKFKTRRPSIPPTRAPKELTIVVKAAWFGDSPHVSVYSGIGHSIFVDGTGFAVTDTPAYHPGVGPFSVFVAVAGVAAIAIIAFKFRERKSREQYAPLV
ncbi:hypothetical protein JG688_00004649 [Phytophthora aleatoria]|uniref:Putative auto-transporter adhesin head GIN domain-containing protein n=1 Tax=Phytophthora aleatoria TaxID=2496075 RepID=A0A8J5J325_9STRA|nr:hypothetical protein JG688_00004649 [Phytophthora aleatoria]